MTTTLPAGTYDVADPPVRHRASHTVVELRGDLGVASTAALRERLLRALRHSLNLLVIDLSGVSRCDTSMLAVLVGTQRRARLLGTTLRLAAPRPDMVKLLHLTGLDRTLAVHPTLADALAAGRSKA